MIKIKKYNPCEECIKKLKHFFNDNTSSAKEITFLYENKKLYTNIRKEELKLSDNFDYEFSQNEMLIINLPDSFYIKKISECPIPAKHLVDDIYCDSIIKRMFSQIEFGFYNEGNITDKEIDICDNIFKSIYSKSHEIKYRNIKLSVQKFNSLQKEGWINKSIICGIIYAVYDYCVFKQNTAIQTDHQLR